ncbi:hypothetical protein EBS80_05050, partial [bacterium]|nr:hypothetical protein [bacterium]
MKRIFFALVISLSVLTNVSFLHALPARAADPMCLCYHTGQDCDAFNPTTGSAADCTAYCKGLYGIEYVSDVYEGDNSTMGADTALRACVISKSDAAAATQASASVSTRTISYATPELSVAIPGVNFSIPYLKNGNVTSNFLATYVAGMYAFLINFAITVAIIMIMVGGVQYVIGASTGEIGKAKERISNAVTGFVLL